MLRFRGFGLNPLSFRWFGLNPLRFRGFGLSRCMGASCVMNIWARLRMNMRDEYMGASDEACDTLAATRSSEDTERCLRCAGLASVEVRPSARRCLSATALGSDDVRAESRRVKPMLTPSRAESNPGKGPW